MGRVYNDPRRDRPSRLSTNHSNMKITIIDGRVTATAENRHDIEVLMGIKAPERVKRAYTKRKHRKECQICGKFYKGLKLHTTKKHGNS